MTATLIGSNSFGFSDGNAGHVVNLGSTPSVGQEDVLCINSNTVVTSVVDATGGASFVLAPTRVNSQGSYIYRRKATGGEGSTVTITTSGNHETGVGWSRWGGINVIDDAASSGVDGVSGTSTPSHTTATLAAATELIIAFGALHSLSALPSSPVWAGGYTALTAVTQGSGSPGVTNYVGYKQPVGTAAESPSVSWTGNVSDRYMLTITFTTSGSLSAALTTATETDTAGTLGRAKARLLAVAGSTNTAQTITRAKARTLAVASTTTTAGTLGRAKARTLAVAGDTATAGTVARTKARVLAVAGDTATAGTLGRAKIRTLGVAGDISTAGTLVAGHARLLAVATETDAARVLGKVRILAVAGDLSTALTITQSGVTTVTPATQRATVVRGPQRAGVVRGPQRATVVRDA